MGSMVRACVSLLIRVSRRVMRTANPCQPCWETRSHRDGLHHAQRVRWSLGVVRRAGPDGRLAGLLAEDDDRRRRTRHDAETNVGPPTCPRSLGDERQPATAGSVAARHQTAPRAGDVTALTLVLALIAAWCL